MQNILNIKRAFTVAALLGSIAIANIPGPSTVLLVENGSERLQLRHQQLIRKQVQRVAEDGSNRGRLLWQRAHGGSLKAVLTAFLRPDVSDSLAKINAPLRTSTTGGHSVF